MGKKFQRLNMKIFLSILISVAVIIGYSCSSEIVNPNLRLNETFEESYIRPYSLSY